MSERPKRPRGRPALAEGQDENRGGRSPVLCTRVVQTEADDLYRLVATERYEMSEFLRLLLQRILRDQQFQRQVLTMLDPQREQLRGGESHDRHPPDREPRVPGRGGAWGR